MRLLAADDETETLLLVSKPPAPEAVHGLGAVDVDGRRVVAAFVGWDGGEAPFEVYPTLEAGAFAAAGAPPAERREATRSTAAGTARPVLRRHARLRGRQSDRPRPRTTGILDLGEEEYTQGRPHPMVNLELRRRMLREAMAGAGYVLLDVVHGHGSHADPRRARGAARASSRASGR